MAANATIIAAWQFGGEYYIAVRPNAPAADSSVEYLGSTPVLNPDGTGKSKMQILTECIASVRTNRAANQAVLTPDPGSLGPVAI